MNRLLLRSFAVAGMASAVGMAAAQGVTLVPGWDVDCFDPENMMPRSVPYSFNAIQNDLMTAVMGLQGTVTYGGDGGPCFDPARTADIRGRFALSYGPRGSNIRTSANFVDDFMSLTFGAPIDPAWCYAATSRDGVLTRYGANGFSEFFVGFSNRYMWGVTVNDNVRTRCQVEVVADAVRFRWRLTNLDTQVRNIGLMFGAAVAMRLNTGGSSNSESGNAVRSHLFGKLGYISLPTGRPPLTDRLFDRNVDSSNFPDYVDFVFGQTDAIGMRLENEPSASTQDVAENNPTNADQFYLGNAVFLLGWFDDAGAVFPRTLVPDIQFNDNTAFVQRFPERTVGPGQSIQILHYVRSSWGTSDYKLPYGAAVDAPKTISYNLGTDTISPRPVPVRVYVDNVGGFAFDGKEFPLNDVRIKLEFPSGVGMSITGAPANRNYVRELSLASVNPQQMRFVDFEVNPGNNTVGVVPYTVTIDSQPGNVRKVIQGTINVASRPRLQMFPDANMIAIPFDLEDNSMDAVFEPFLDPNVPGGDLQFYRWDPVQQGYVIVNTVPRGQGFWAIYNKTGASSVIANYGGRPRNTTGFLEGSPLIQLKQGFNQIGNPYNYRIPINQVIGVSAANPQISRTFQEMIDLGYIDSFVTFWNPTTKAYELVAAEDGVLEPHRAYWINVRTQDDLTLSYPPVNELFVAGQSRKANGAPLNYWPQTDQKWRLRLAARSGESLDNDNYVGVVRNATEVSKLRAGEAPMSPTQDLAMSIEQTVDGRARNMAQALTDKLSRQEYKLTVESRKAGDVTVTWPNLSQVPKNVRFRLIDPSTNVQRSLRQTSGYTFRMDKPGKRTLTLVMEPGGIDAAIIGNVVVSQPSRGTNGPVTISYSLGADATTSIRVLSSTGKEVYAVSRGRADRAGENTVTWNLRNSANQAVAPGVYRVEILAESTSGDRARKFAVVNVIR